MMLTTKSKYAVMGMLYIANVNHSNPVGLAEIAKKQNIALGYLEQLFNKLKVSGIVKSIKGPRGGYLLSRSLKEITIDNIIDAVEENIKITRCSSNKGCLSLNIKCSAHYLWEGLEHHIRSYFNNISLEDVISGKLKSEVLKVKLVDQG